MEEEKLTKQLVLQRKQKEENDQFLQQAADDPASIDWNSAMKCGRRMAKMTLKNWAQRVVDDYWATHWQHRKGDGVPKSFGCYGARILEREWTIYIQWYRVEIHGTPQHFTKRMVSLTPPKGSYRVSERQFGQAKGWELEAIIKAENELSKVRRCAEQLDKIRSEVNGFKRLVDAYQERVNLELDWV